MWSKKSHIEQVIASEVLSAERAGSHYLREGVDEKNHTTLYRVCHHWLAAWLAKEYAERLTKFSFRNREFRTERCA